MAINLNPLSTRGKPPSNAASRPEGNTGSNDSHNPRCCLDPIITVITRSSEERGRPDSDSDGVNRIIHSESNTRQQVPSACW
ncbi:hypothetical protein RRG08_022082 [Elysia crispata]|uniref:Uncharacterized protein n=1 Tax=Elysia crispata TaxID=231223 RepID=A0AAE0Y2N8_9GAST|nr:hypothetical protein RRG08_022082 [Elysia crispata]